MNYYERIQNAINYIEKGIDEKLDLKEVSKKAYMSLSNFYRLFFSLVGYTAKEYIRLRRMSEAITELDNNNETILNIAMKYGYNDHASFTKAFKRIVRVTPKTFRQKSMKWSFDKINILEEYYSSVDDESFNLYPDIKVLKQIPTMKVACYCYYGKNPEYKTFDVISTWIRKSNLNIEKDRVRVFGFNNPSPKNIGDEEYGYEVWVTIDEQKKISDSLVKTKLVPGGLYAVCGVKNLIIDGNEGMLISETWKRLAEWLKVSKYKYGNHQWLEEHLNFDKYGTPTVGMDLYIPIMLES